MDNSSLLDQTGAVAVIGMAGRFPGAGSTDEFWQNLTGGVETISFFTAGEVLAAGEDPSIIDDQNYVKAKGVLDGVDLFDAVFFGFTPKEAEITDPQQRLFLECGWHALEDAGYSTDSFEGRIGVFAGANLSTYLINLYTNPDVIRSVGAYRVLIGNDKDYLPTWVSYKLNLRGPSVTIQTACSTSLVAIHIACQSLINGECDVSLAGGVSVSVPNRVGYLYREGGINSPDGHCRAFDASAMGTVGGNGVGVVVLKRLAEALADRDHVYAVIKGSAINNDGSRKVGYTAPSVNGQAEVVAEAQAIAGVGPETISFVEAHGTATPIGDPIEVAALTQVFRASTDKRGFCAIGSVKTNVGHLDSAAGVTGFIKSVLALRHRILPPSLHFEQPNPKLDLANSPFYVCTTPTQLTPGETPLRAGVSSFGIGGTNVHLILEEASPGLASGPSRPWQLLLVSAKTESALETLTQMLTDYLKQNDEANLADIAYTIQIGRTGLDHRRMLLAESREDALDSLESRDPKRIVSGMREARTRRVAFMFPGQGTQYVRMALDVYQAEQAFRENVNVCSRLLEPHLGFDLRQLLFPEDAQIDNARERLDQTYITQPSLFVVEYALAKLWMEWGVQPDAMIGHSIGEYVAACLAGVFSLEDCLALVAARGRLVQSVPGGEMLAAALSEGDVRALLDDRVSLAAINGPSQCVVSGPADAIAIIRSRLATRGTKYRDLRTSHAFHSQTMEPILEPFAEAVTRLRLNTPQIPFVSNLTGRYITAAQATDPQYWVKQLRYGVRFSDGIKQLLSEPDRVLIEVGPGNTLTVLARQNADKPGRCVAIPSLGRSEDEASDQAVLLEALGRLWLEGVRIDWKSFYGGEQRNRIRLPGYPFERRRCWIDPPTAVQFIAPLEPREHLPPNPKTHQSRRERPLPAGEMETEVPMSKAAVGAGSSSARQEKILSMLEAIIKDLTGLVPEAEDLHVTYFELGIDSLLLIQASQAIQEKFGIRISFTKLFEELSTIHKLAVYLDQELPQDAIQPDPAGEQASAPATMVEPEPSGVSKPPPEIVEMWAQHDETDAVPMQGNEPQPPISRLANAERMVSVVPAAENPPSGGEYRPVQFDDGSNLAYVDGGNGYAAPGAELERVITRQLDLVSQLMFKQLDVMRRGAAGAPVIEQQVTTRNGAEQRQGVAAQRDDGRDSGLIPGQPGIQTPPSSTAAMRSATPKANPSNGPSAEGKPAQAHFVPHKPIEVGSKGGLTDRQQKHLDALLERYSAKTKGSKRLTQEYRQHLADSRVSVLFRLLWKEIAYPIIGTRSQGSRVWDVDGNEYIDITMGFGVHLFGHSAPFIKEAIEAQLKEGIALGPQSELAGKASELISELGGVERVNFCNSGTEALIGAMRVVRTVRNRSKIAMFAGSYHGWSDATLIRPIPANGQLRGVPGAPGVTQKAIEDMMILEYGDPRSLDIIKANADELAAVMVEPVQSRRPDFQPREFLHDLRELTTRTGVPLLFDEMITGFRSHPGGAQAWFGVEADLVTYGKVIGGGMPIGVIAGKAALMDSFDGGMWSFGDLSYPTAEKTLMAGCYFKHPLTMAASLAVLTHLKDNGPALQERLNDQTTRMADRLNGYFKQNDVPINIVHFASLFRFSFGRELKYPELFFFHLAEKGIFTWEGGNYYLCTAHTDEDVDFLIQAVVETVEELRDGEFLPDPPGSGSSAQRLRGTGSSRASGPDDSGKATAIPPCAARQASSASSTNPTICAATSLETAREPEKVEHRMLDSGIAKVASATNESEGTAAKGVKFSLYYFGNYGREYNEHKYDLILESVKLADRLGFEAVWIPERHFNSFGGFSPNPSVLGAAIARETERIRIRAGSVVLPLHNPIRVAEEWSLVDNLSNGRVGISFASGWHPNDFAFAPDSYPVRHEIMYEGIGIVHKLWRGESIRVKDGAGSMFDVHLVPMPKQARLPTWLTVASAETAARAGQLGAGFLTNFMDHALEEVSMKIDAYRESLAKSGYEPATGHVTIQLHTFLGSDVEKARQKVREPFIDYLGASFKLLGNKIKSQGTKVDVASLPPEDLQYLLSMAFDQYVHRGALFGTPESCRPTIDQLIAVGVDEVCCLIDFGMDIDSTLEGLHYLDELRRLYEHPGTSLVAQSADSQTYITTARETEAIHLRDPSRPQAASASLTSPGKAAYKAPLTETQSQLWALSRISAEVSAAYNESISVQVHGPLNVRAMRSAVQQVVDRHEALRTTFSAEGDFQQFNPTMEIEVPLIDFSQLAEADKKSKVEKWLKAEIRREFDLVNGPLIRVQIAKLEEQRFIVLWTNHHIIVDGDSITVVLSDLNTIYLAEREGKAGSLPAPMAYREYLAKQAGLQQSPDLQESEEYWLKQFGDSIPVLELPTDRPRPAVQTFSRALHCHSVSLETFDALRNVGASKGATMFMLLLAAFKVVLHKLTNQRQIVVMINTADRSFVGRKDLVGYRVNPLAVGTTISPESTFSEFATLVRRQVLGAYEHQAVSLNWLSKKLKSWRDTGRLLPVSVGMNLSNEMEPVTGLFGMDAEVTAFPTSNPLLDIYLDIAEKSDRLLLRCNYNSDLFDERTIVRWMRNVETLLEKIAANPDQRIADLSLFTESEERLMLVGWNDTQKDYGGEPSIHEAFEQQAARTPNSVAVEMGQWQISYDELNRRANRLARHLRGLGVGSETIVAAYMDRSVELFVSLLATLKAGAAYVPLDLMHPRDRLVFLLEDTGSPVVLTRRQFADNLPEYWGTRISIDQDWESIAYERDDNLDVGVDSDSLAYVIYTSGSTGRPKGVMQTHGGALNRFNWMWEVFPFEPDDICCQKTNLSFVDSVWEMFGPLLRGVKNVIVPDEIVKDPFRFIDHVRDNRVTRIVAVPSMLRLMLDTGQDNLRKLSSLKLCVSSGEALPTDLCQRLLEPLPRCKVVNLYGSSEISADSTAYEVSNTEWENSVPVGKPIGNTQVYLLDSHMNPVGLGAEGELYISGAGLARGYLNRPDLTAEKFLANPFAVATGTRMFKTGDTARFLEDGNLEFTGRVDHQVKIRGYRIELGEIETHLNQHPSIREAAVAIHGNGNEKRLAAYVVPKAKTNGAHSDKEMKFSLFYFAEDEAGLKEDKYRLYLEGAKFADSHGFDAVWTPERHFHEVAGIYPNPSVLSAALAMVTKNIHLRAGSVVLPHHRPIRVAEEWSVVDNLSNGRVGVSFTSGWVPKDFAFFPEHFANKRQVMLDGIDDVQKLWRGETISAVDGVGKQFEVGIYPRPKQSELPMWITCTGDPEMFIKAGELGANVLTALLAQTVDQAAEKIALYRESRGRHGHDPDAGLVTMMLHTYVGEDEGAVIETVREPFYRYIRAHLGLFASLVDSLNVKVDSEIADNLDQVVAFAFERYHKTASLMGSASRCARMIDRLKAIGVSEVACLIDFGLDFDSVMEGLRHLTSLKDATSKPAETTPGALRSFLKNKVPDYMVPSVFMTLDALPLTTSGKIDRESLPSIEFSPDDAGADFVEPRTPAERQLAEIWAGVLNLKRVGANDNFFELGGDSILGVRAAVRANERGLHITPMQFFQYQTLGELAAAIVRNGEAAPEAFEVSWADGELDDIAIVMQKMNAKGAI